MVLRVEVVTFFLEDGRFSSKQILSGAQGRLIPMMSLSGSSASQIVFGSYPAELFRWEDKGEGLMFSQDTSATGQFAQRWMLRMRAQEASHKEIANSKLRRLLA